MKKQLDDQKVVTSGKTSHRYKKGDYIGGGAFACVFECTRESDQKIFAMKMISFDREKAED